MSRLSALIVSAALAVLVSAGIAAASLQSAPDNTGQPTVSGQAQVGEELTANNGTWANNPTTYTYQWQRCNSDGSSCGAIDGATGKTYGVRSADESRTLRVVVTARNADGAASAASDRTSVIRSATGTTTTATTTTSTAPATNHRPTISILSVRFSGARVFVRFRACDDSHKNLTIPERDSKPGVASYNRRFATLAPPSPCASAARSWFPAPRFRHGRYTLTLWAMDKSGLMSSPARRTFNR
jgi:hypothetical protein